ncbi:MAG: FHA domain-containing protein [Leptolyngbyaceae cyanobacterium bins.302]|nr:FHA domain-containing protein [Leptolyngbyaceae cyanobacterium bins.302]
MPSELRHVLIIEDDRKGLQQHVLGASLHYIGRDTKCDIRLSSQFVSRRQATLVRIGNEDGTFFYRIVDGVPKGRTSSNGMIVNGRKTIACDLHDRDEIMFGPQVRLTYRLTELDDSPLFDDTLIPTKELRGDEAFRYYKELEQNMARSSIEPRVDMAKRHTAVRP